MFKFLDGWKTYGAGIGLIGLAVWQASQSQWEAAMTSVLAGLAAFGLRSAIQKGTGV